MNLWEISKDVPDGDMFPMGIAKPTEDDILWALRAVIAEDKAENR